MTGGKYYIAAMKKIYHLSSCTTCQRILGETAIGEKGFVMQDIKTEKITPDQLEALRDRADRSADPNATAGPINATVTGTQDGAVLKVESIEVQ